MPESCVMPPPEDDFARALRESLSDPDYQMAIYRAACELTDRRELGRLFGLPSPDGPQLDSHAE